jgi:hypothetical protein
VSNAFQQSLSMGITVPDSATLRREGRERKSMFELSASDTNRRQLVVVYDRDWPLSAGSRHFSHRMRPFPPARRIIHENQIGRREICAGNRIPHSSVEKPTCHARITRKLSFHLLHPKPIVLIGFYAKEAGEHCLIHKC